MSEVITAQADDNIIQPFQLESSSLRGRCVRSGEVLDQILSAHDYPNPVAHLVAETVTLALLLSSMLKYEGIFTLQASGDGPVKMLVADVSATGEVRGCAAFDEERVEAARQQILALKTPEGSQNHLAQYLGTGYIAFTVDQGAGMDRNQGIVELKGSSLVDCVQHYFSQSEQIKTGIKMAVGERDGAWRAGGLMLQNMPEDDGQGEDFTSNLSEDDWRRAMVLMDSCSDDEFLDPDLHSNTLLVRLFHEEGVRVFDALPMVKSCRCEEEKVRLMIAGMPFDDIEYITKDGKIEVKCEFCSHNYVLDPAEFVKQEQKDVEPT